MITDEMIAAAAAELNEAMIMSLPHSRECKHQFSQRFERKMKKLIYRVNHPFQQLVLRRVASILLVILLGSTLVISFSPTVRAAVFGWIKQAYDSFFSYYFETEIDTNSSNEYQIDPLPEGYVEISYTEDSGTNTYVYANEQNNILVFTYSISPESSAFFLEQEGFFIEEVLVSEKPADLYLAKDGSMNNGIIWCNEEVGLIFFITGQFDGGELIHIAESVKIKCPK